MDEERKKTILNAMLDLGSIAMHALRINDNINEDTLRDGEQAVCMIQAIMTAALDVDPALLLEVMSDNKAQFEGLDDLKKTFCLDDEWINQLGMKLPNAEA